LAGKLADPIANPPISGRKFRSELTDSPARNLLSPPEIALIVCAKPTNRGKGEFLLHGCGHYSAMPTLPVE
jgi:hypothetical protein